ncbi:MAG: response regulator transcription factor [Myxococcota bacterium]
MGRVLVVEDDPDVRMLIARGLEHAGHASVLASSGRSGLELARSVPPDLVILDLMLPDVPGTAIAKSLQSDLRTRAIPFIIVSALSGESERIAGLELGADDYLTKPFSVRELVLRVNVALRRRPTLDPPPRSTIEVPPLSIDPHERRVSVAGKRVSLTPIEFKLLLTLADRADQVQTREALLADVWGVHPDLETRTVDVHVKRLREKLEPAGAMIETVRGVGYRFREEGAACSEPSS